MWLLSGVFAVSAVAAVMLGVCAYGLGHIRGWSEGNRHGKAFVYNVCVKPEASKASCTREILNIKGDE